MTDAPIIPVYLNQSVVFDLVAMLQGGLATVTRVTASESAGSTDRSKLEGRFGLSAALSTLFRVGLAAESNDEATSHTERNTAAERVHTPPSLFYEVRRDLRQRNVLKKLVHDGDIVRPGELVEFTALLRPNPVIQVMIRMREFLDMTLLFQEPTKHFPGKGGKKPTADEMDASKLKKQISQMLEKLKTGGTVDIVTDAIVAGTRAVITLEEQYLNDPSMADLVDGEFTVLGKVIRTIRDESAAISLLRKTPFSALPDVSVNDALGHFSAMSDSGTFQVPQLEWRISGPVIHVLPVAIFS